VGVAVLRWESACKHHVLLAWEGRGCTNDLFNFRRGWWLNAHFYEPLSFTNTCATEVTAKHTTKFSVGVTMFSLKYYNLLHFNLSSVLCIYGLYCVSILCTMYLLLVLCTYCWYYVSIVSTMYLLLILCIYYWYYVSIVGTMYLLLVLCIYCWYYVSIVGTMYLLSLLDAGLLFI
jgi:hypothetical protein